MSFDKISGGEKVVNRAEQLKSLEGLELPKDIVVTSASAIKVDTVKKVIAQIFPNKEFNIVGVKASSGINEQPLGEVETALGARNRIASAESLVEPSQSPRAFISVENGIFKINDSEYEDKAMVVIKLPDGKVYSATSPRGVIFPVEAVKATLEKEGGFKDHTVGSTLAEIYAAKGIPLNKQDPHTTLTNGEFTREAQMISAIEEALISAAK
jgi:non-canonical (house-cleaning) NTP pyrophosphatase